MEWVEPGHERSPQLVVVVLLPKVAVVLQQAVATSGSTGLMHHEILINIMEKKTVENSHC